MNMLILHFSDIHLKAQGNTIFNKVDNIIGAINNLIIDSNLCFIVISGDIAYSGKHDEYSEALLLLLQLHEGINNINNKIEIRNILVSGNHDCDFSGETEVRTALIRSMSHDNSFADASIVHQLTTVQNSFFVFLGESTDKHIFDNFRKLYYTYEYTFGNYNILFNCYNSAWMSQINEKQGHLFFPVSILKENSRKFDIILSVFHHNYNWLVADNEKLFKKHIENSSDFTLTGHDHQLEQYDKIYFPGNIERYLEGGILQDHDNENLSQFNAIFVNLAGSVFKRIKYTWEIELYNSIETEWEQFKRNDSLLVNIFQINDNFAKELNDPGVEFAHPNKDKIFLTDIFIYPNIREYLFEKNSKKLQPSITKGGDIISYFYDNNLLILTGPDQSGKTSFAKIIFQEMLQKKGLIPVLLNGDNLTSCDKDKIFNLIDEAFNMQYSINLLEKYRQLDRDNKYLIIDDFNKTRLNKIARNKLIDILKLFYNKILVLGDETMGIEFIDYQDDITNPWLEFKQCELTEFGPILRDKLIKKWILIGREHIFDEEEFYFKINRVAHTVNNIIGKGLLPPFPFFILFIVQQFEIGAPVTAGGSSYGYCYECFINNSIRYYAKNTEEIHTRFNYLSELAYCMYSGGNSILTNLEMNEYHVKYCKEYSIYLDLQKMIADLTKSSILKNLNGHLSFKYKHIYYYFIARYLRDNLNDSSIKEIISKICLKLHREENAYIIIFLTYLSKDPFILDEVLKNAKSILSSYTPCEIDKDFSFINKIITEPLKIELDESETEIRREKLIEHNESLNGYNSHDAENQPIGNENDLVDERFNDLIKLNTAFKTIEILGQTLKNFSGSLRGIRKHDILKECYFLGLRGLKLIVNLLQENLENIFRDTRRFLQEHFKDIKDNELDNMANQYIMKISFIILISVIKKMSWSLGSERLELTYEEVKREVESISVDLINLCIKLDHYLAFPEKDAVALGAKIKHNSFLYSVLRQLIVERFYLIPCKSYQVKQKICQSLDIPIRKIRTIEGTKKR